MTDIEKALYDPGAVYQHPRHVLADEALTKCKKKQIGNLKICKPPIPLNIPTATPAPGHLHG